MHCWIELSREALLHNYKVFCDLLGKDRVVPVLKSNAYGHGIEAIYSILKEATPRYLAITYSYEAELLRRLGYEGRLLNVGPIRIEDLKISYELGIELLVGNEEILDAWLSSFAQQPKIHIKMDTGLSRRGFSLNVFRGYLSRLVASKENILGIASHYANVEDVTNTDFAHLQLNRLLEAATIAKEAGLNPILTHCSASASSLLINETALDLNRIGISTYGLWASEKTRLSYFAKPNHAELVLKPVLSWKTRITSLREIHEGDFVGYGCTFKAMRTMKIAVIPIGYYEGYPRVAASRGAYVLVGGKRCPLLGRISMNMMVIDLGNIPSAKVGDLVTLIGRQGAEEVGADLLAEWSDTINYEVVTRLNPLIPRTIVESF